MRVYQVIVGALRANCYLASDENGNTAVIDPGAEADRILEECARHGLTVRAILLTHAHIDHIGAAAALCRQTDAPLYIHAADESALANGEQNLSAPFCIPLTPIRGAKTLSDGEIVSVGSLDFTVIHTPGHTKGSCCYRCEDTLFSGDTLFFESIGRTDFPGGDCKTLQRSLRRLLASADDCVVLPGHEQRTTLSHERQYNPFV